LPWSEQDLNCCMPGWLTKYAASCNVQLYIENILALEAKARAAGRGTGRPLPLAIMTSDDTHAATRQLLADHGHFGAAPEQIHLIKQEKVRVHTTAGSKLGREATLSSRSLAKSVLSSTVSASTQPPRMGASST
jgi:hypothetical protein